MSTFVPSSYQKAIFEAGRKGDKNIIVSATAGSGKTRTIQEFIKNYIPKNKSWIYLVFNKKNQLEAKEKLANMPGGEAKTLHSLGNRELRNVYGNFIMDNQKTYSILEDTVVNKMLWQTIAKVVQYVKNTLTDSEDEDSMIEMCDFYNIKLNGNEKTVFKAVNYVIQRSKKDTQTIDYDDMIWLPVVLDIPMRKYDYVLVDEAQDLNETQVQMILKIRKPNGCTIVIGDRNQAIYGFRGAGINAMDYLGNMLDAVEFPLSISYRNPKSVVAFVNKTFPNITHECGPNAKQGKVEEIDYPTFMKKVQPKDMVLCRTNAPLVEPAFELIRNGKKVIIVGKSIGDQLENLINRVVKMCGATDLSTFLIGMKEYQQKQTEKLKIQKKEASILTLSDRVDTIFAIADESKTITDLTSKVKFIFRDNIEGIVFSSVHRAKGLESENVYILRYDLMPHPYAVKQGNPQQLKEEDNCKFVALTRSLNNLYIVRE
jgi:superfamily I DNA/RNA helicase